MLEIDPQSDATRGEQPALEIDPQLADELPPLVRNALAKMPREQQAIFIEEYKRKRKDKVLYIAIAVLFPIQHFLFGQVGLGVLFWLSFLFFVGLIWWVAEWFLAPGRVRDWNYARAVEILRDIRIVQG